MLVQLAAPAVGTALFQVLFNVTDTFWVGRTLGPSALAGVSVASYCVWILVAFGDLIGAGLTAVAARRHGERDPASAARATGTALMLALLLGLLVPLLGIPVLGPLFRFMGASPDVAETAREFLVVQLLGAFPIYGYFVVAAAFRSAGDTRTPFWLLGASVVLNLALAPLLILGWGPLPALGVYGAALTTVLIRLGAFVVGIGLLRRRHGLALAFDAGVARTIVRIGLPTMLTGVLFSLIYVLLTRVTSRFGTPALAALGVGHKVEGVSYMIAVGFGLAAEAAVGQNLGAGRPDRARQAGWLAVRLATALTSCLGVLFLVAPEPLARIFTDDPAVVKAAALYLRIVAPAQLVIALENVLEGALSGAGYTFWTMTWIVAFSVVRIPLAELAAPRFGLAGVWWIISLTAMARALALAALWRWGQWERVRV
jgi:putative MATE family efflux protein